MRLIGPLLLLTLLASRLSAVPVEELLQEALTAESKLDAIRALALFRQADAAKPNDAFIIQKIAKQYSDMVPDQTTDTARREFAESGLKYARRSFDLEPTNAVYALSLAICHGHLAMVSDVRSKVEYSRLIKQGAELSLRLDADYAWAHHVLGRWHYEVAGLGVTARFFAKLLYGGIPPATVSDGVSHLKRAAELEPAELNHWIELGFAYAAAGKKADARKSWEHGLAMTDRSKHDATSKKRARDGLKGLE